MLTLIIVTDDTSAVLLPLMHIPSGMPRILAFLQLSPSCFVLILNRKQGMTTFRFQIWRQKERCPGFTVHPSSISGSIFWIQGGLWSWKVWPTTGRAWRSGGGCLLRACGFSSQFSIPRDPQIPPPIPKWIQPHGHFTGSEVRWMA